MRIPYGANREYFASATQLNPPKQNKRAWLQQKTFELRNIGMVSQLREARQTAACVVEATCRLNRCSGRVNLQK